VAARSLSGEDKYRNLIACSRLVFSASINRRPFGAALRSTLFTPKPENPLD